MMMPFVKCAGAAVFALSAAMLSTPVLAVPVTVAGTTVNFTFDSALTGLFGAPSVVGDTFSFYPTSFKAQSFNGGGLVATSETFNVTVNANSGYLISAVNLTEDGDYYNIGSGSAVAVGGKLYVRDGENPLGSAASSSIVAGQPLTDTTSLGNFQTTNWMASAGVMTPAGWGGADGNVTGVNVTLQNILLASSENVGGGAFIEKKFAGLSFVTSPVPEPQTYAMFLAGLGLVGYLGLRRGRARAAEHAAS